MSDNGLNKCKTPQLHPEFLCMCMYLYNVYLSMYVGTFKNSGHPP